MLTDTITLTFSLPHYHTHSKTFAFTLSTVTDPYSCSLAQTISQNAGPVDQGVVPISRPVSLEILKKETEREKIVLGFSLGTKEVLCNSQMKASYLYS